MAFALLGQEPVVSETPRDSCFDSVIYETTKQAPIRLANFSAYGRGAVRRLCTDSEKEGAHYCCGVHESCRLAVSGGTTLVLCVAPDDITQRIY